MLFVALLSFVQIVLESFPVSSSGNVLLVERFLQLYHSAFSIPELSEQFWFLLHGPTILIVLFFYRKKWFYEYLPQLLKGDKKIFPLVFYGMVTSLITVCTYLYCSLYGSFFIPLGIGFALTTLLLFSLLLIKDNKKGAHEFVLKPISHGIIVGLFQAVAMCIPGLSRLGATFVAARWCGMPGLFALEYSLLIEFPLITAGFFKGLWWFIKYPENVYLFDSFFFSVITVASILAYAGLTFVHWCVERNKMWFFGLYTSVLALLCFLNIS